MEPAPGAFGSVAPPGDRPGLDAPSLFPVVADMAALDARVISKLAERSIAGQIEYWAQLGRAIEPLLEGAKALALRRARATTPLSALLDSVDSAEGRRRVAEFLVSRPYPHYEVSRDEPGWLIRIDADGTRTRGRFVNREFLPAGE